MSKYTSGSAADYVYKRMTPDDRIIIVVSSIRRPHADSILESVVHIGLMCLTRHYYKRRRPVVGRAAIAQTTQDVETVW